MNELEFKTQVIRYLTGELSPQQAEVLQKEIDSNAYRKKFFEEYRKVWQMSGQEEIEFPVIDITSEWEKFENAQVGNSTHKVHWLRPFMRVAAIGLLLISSVIIFNRLLNRDANQHERMAVFSEDAVREFTLPDGSIVWLSKDSKIEFISEFAERVVHLDGQALFEVQHLNNDQKFVVETDRTKTTVLGTRFMVDSRAEEQNVRVFVEEGKVAFQEIASNDQVQIISPGEEAVYRDKNQVIEKSLSDDSNILSWKTGVFEFRDATLNTILDHLKVHYDVDFEVTEDGILDCTYNSTFDNLDLEEILEELQFGLNLSIENSATSRYIINGTPCE